MLQNMIGIVSEWLYTYILIIMLIGVGVYFTIRTKFVQFSLFKNAIKILGEKSENSNAVSSFEALMISTASRVGVGNIAGVSTAICLGGKGAVFWMWLIAIIGGASAFIESTLAQIYKVRDKDGGSFGGPAYYIEAALKSRALGVIFALMLIFTYMGGFNMVASFNIASAFESYNLNTSIPVPKLVGFILALVTAFCIFGGGKRLGKITGIIVPVMAISYIVVAFIVIIKHIDLFPLMIKEIFINAFDFQAIFGGFTGSCVMYGIKRGLYSNEAGVGSAPNAAAAASVSHPVKQGLVQMLSVFIDTIIVCTSTAFLLLCSGVEPDATLKGVPYVQKALEGTFGVFGVHFVTFALFCFAFTSILGNFYYAEANLKYLNKKDVSDVGLMIFRTIAVIIVYFGAQLNFGLAWDLADIMMGGMALINIPVIFLLCKPAILCLEDYKKQLKEGKEPVFKAKNIDLNYKTDFWN